MPIVRLGELGSFDQRLAEKVIYHKNLERVAYVYAEAVGRPPAEVVADVGADLVSTATGAAAVADATPAAPRPLWRRTFLSNGGGIPWSLPAGT